MTPTEQLQRLLQSALDGRSVEPLADSFAEQASYWDAVTGTKTGRGGAASALRELIADLGPAGATPSVDVRAGDAGAAVAEVTAGAVRAAFVAICDEHTILELRCYVDPLDLRSGRGAAAVGEPRPT